MKKKKAIDKNFLEQKPLRKESLKWTCDGSGAVTLEIENKGVFNRVAQKLLKKPKISYIHLEEFGSFIWQQIDGERDIIKIGEAVRSHFGEKAEPLYERLAQYFKILEGYSFISWED